MLPTITLGTLHISSYWLMFAVGVCAMSGLMIQRRSRYRLGILKAGLFSMVLAVCGVIGARLLYVLENWNEVMQEGLSQSDGVSFFGAVFLIPPLMAVLGLLFGLKPSQTLDACAPCVAVMIAFIRFGCFLNGCCGGWKMALGNVRFHWPAQAMESMGDFFILILLLRMEEQNSHSGKRYAVFLVAYGILRFFVEFFRNTPKEWLGLGHGHWFAILGCLIGGGILLMERMTQRSAYS